MLHHTNFVTEASSADVSPPSDYIDDEIIRILLDNDDEDLTEHLKVPEVREEPTPQSESCVNKLVPVTSACEVPILHENRLSCSDTDSEAMSEVSESSPLQLKPERKAFRSIEYRYGKKRLSLGFKKYSLEADKDLIRVTFPCGLDCHGKPCGHRFGLFHTADDNVKQMADGSYLYNGSRLTWGNLVPPLNKKTRGKLAQTMRTHFATKHGWDKHNDNLPQECRLKR